MYCELFKLETNEKGQPREDECALIWTTIMLFCLIRTTIMLFYHLLSFSEQFFTH